MGLLMVYLLFFLLMAALGGCGYLAFQWWQVRSESQRKQREADEFREAATKRLHETDAALQAATAQATRLAQWEIVADADDKANELLSEARAAVAQAEADAQILTGNAQQHYEQTVETAKAEAKELTQEAKTALATATEQAAETLAEAHRRAEEIAGKAYDAVRNAELYEKTVRSMKNIIKGYGDEYLQPAESLLDDLAEEFAHKDAGQQLKLARATTKEMIKSKRAASCDYVEVSRREGAEHFVIDAFNGKVDSILSRVRHDNYGVLEEKIKDAFTLVNFGGKPFKDARIIEAFLAARLAELKWAVVAQELKKQEQEEQRQIREQMREEEKARREYEKAIKEAAKEEKMLREAMAKAESQMKTASAEQRAEFEAKLAELNLKLHEAEDRNIRALSMAQQTRRGHVYIISNTGSFGEDVYKIGLTRRLEPLDRVKELGDASVPFEFDVHAIIWSEDAPALETTLHKHFALDRVNKVNHRKEFFRASLTEIRKQIESMEIESHWTMAAEAQQFRETLAIERAIEKDEAAKEAWLNRQLMVEVKSVS
jgi:Meiotically Up-regulated Gene 113 (MUG113) protein/uncharacterized protein DUF4041